MAGTVGQTSLRSPLDSRHVVAVEPSFPLTLTLSLGERGQPPPGACFAHTGLANSVAGMAQRQRTILPLPRGEGWGEGKEIVVYPAVSSESRAQGFNRRQFLGATAAMIAGGLTAVRSWAADSKAAARLPRYRIAVCDWMILKRQKLGAFQLTKDIGADGLEVDMGGLGDRETFDNQLAKPDVREQFLAKSRELGVEIFSLAMSGFYAQSFAERQTVPRMLDDCIATMKATSVKVAFLPLGVRGDLVKHSELRPAMVERLKAAGGQAEKAGVIIGVETALAAKDEVKLLEDIGSPAIRSYFNFANALQGGRDLLAELRTLGRERICQIHCTDEDGVWLENNKRLDLTAVKKLLDEMGWSGWLVIERSRDAKNPRDVKGNFGANARYLKKVFQQG